MGGTIMINTSLYNFQRAKKYINIFFLNIFKAALSPYQDYSTCSEKIVNKIFVLLKWLEANKIKPNGIKKGLNRRSENKNSMGMERERKN